MAVIPASLIDHPASFFVEIGLLIALRKDNARGFVSRLVAGMAVLVLAAVAPLKAENLTTVGPLPTTPLTIAAFNESFGHHSGVPIISTNAAKAGVSIHFSADELTLGHFLSELSEQTNTRATVGNCGTGANLLFGGSPMLSFVSLHSEGE